MSDFRRVPIDVHSMRQPIAPPRADIAERAAARLAGVATLPGALSKLSKVAVWIAATQGQVAPRQLTNVRLVIFAGDHGVSAQGFSALPSASTGATVRAALSGQLGLNSMSLAHGISVRVLDIGVDEDFADLDDETRTALQEFKIRRSSRPIHLEDALTEAEVHAALSAGATVARQEVEAGAQLLISGDLGIGNTTGAAGLIAAALGLPAAEVVRAGSGTDDSTHEYEIGAIDAALMRVRERATDPIQTLAALGSADLAASAGYLLTGARLGVPALLDGLMALASALTAHLIAPGAAAWFLAGHRSTEPAQILALDSLGLSPVLDLQMRLGEGSGAVAAVPVLRSATAMLVNMALLTDLTHPPGAPSGDGPP